MIENMEPREFTEWRMSDGGWKDLKPWSNMKKQKTGVEDSGEEKNKWVLQIARTFMLSSFTNFEQLIEGDLTSISDMNIIERF